MKDQKNIESYDKLNQFHTIKLVPEKPDGMPETNTSLSALYDDFLEKLAQALESIKESKSDNQNFENTKIGSSSFLLACRQIIEESTDQETK